MTNRSFGQRNFRAIAAVSGIVVLAACTTRQTQELAAAQETIDTISKDVLVQAHAPSEFNEARRTLDDAAQASNAETQRHLSYIAATEARIAEARASERASRELITSLAEQRDTNVIQSLEERARTAEARAQELAEELDAVQTERGSVITLGDVLFEVDRAELTSGGQAQLTRLAAFLNGNDGYTAVIEGHTDSTGPASYNQSLSEQRALAVRNSLLNRGVDAERLRAVGLGETRPIAPNDNVAGRQQNRRVEIIVNEGADAA